MDEGCNGDGESASLSHSLWKAAAPTDSRPCACISPCRHHHADLALVFGHVKEDTFSVDAPIEKDPDSEFRMRVGPGGKPAQTQVEVLQRGYLTLQGSHFNAPVTKLRLKPITGRRHQLR